MSHLFDLDEDYLEKILPSKALAVAAVMAKVLKLDGKTLRKYPHVAGELVGSPLCELRDGKKKGAKKVPLLQFPTNPQAFGTGGKILGEERKQPPAGGGVHSLRVAHVGGWHLGQQEWQPKPETEEGRHFFLHRHSRAVGKEGAVFLVGYL